MLLNKHFTLYNICPPYLILTHFHAGVLSFSILKIQSSDEISRDVW